MSEFVAAYGEMLLTGAAWTAVLAAVAGFLGFVLAVPGTTALHLAHPALRLPIRALSVFLRGTPLLVQILIAYYALPALFPAVKLSEFQAATAALALNVAAYN